MGIDAVFIMLLLVTSPFHPEFRKYPRKCLDKPKFEDFICTQKMKICRGRIYATRILPQTAPRPFGLDKSSPYKDQILYNDQWLYRTC